MVNFAPESDITIRPEKKERRIQSLALTDGNIEVQGRMPPLPEIFRRIIVDDSMGTKTGYHLGEKISPGAKEIWETMVALESLPPPKRKGEKRRADEFFAHLKTVFGMLGEEPRKLGWPREDKIDTTTLVREVNPYAKEEETNLTVREQRERQTVKHLLSSLGFRQEKNDPVRRLFGKLAGLVEKTLSNDERDVLEFFYWLNEAREGKGDQVLTTIEQTRARRAPLT